MRKESAHGTGDKVVLLRGKVTPRASLDGHQLCTRWPVKLSAEANLQTRHASSTCASDSLVRKKETLRESLDFFFQITEAKTRDKQPTAAENLWRFTFPGATRVRGRSHEYLGMMFVLSLTRRGWKRRSK